MSVADVPGLHPVAGGAQVRNLLRRYGASCDRAERAALLGRMADELDQAVGEIVAAHPDSYPRELVAGLRGQAGMARFVAEVERRDQTRQVS